MIDKEKGKTIALTKKCERGEKEKKEGNEEYVKRNGRGN